MTSLLLSDRQGSVVCSMLGGKSEKRCQRRKVQSKKGVSNANDYSIQGVLSLGPFLLPPITPASDFLIALFSPQALMSLSFPKPSRGQ